MRIPIALLMLVALPGASDAAKLPPPMRMNLVPANCVPPPPAVPGPCSTLRFGGGTLVMKALRQPQPTCPKTGDPTEAPGATVQVVSVTKDGLAFEGSLSAQVNLTTTFGDDPTANCALRNAVVPNLPSLGGALACKKGRCKGTLYPVACLPAQCADTLIVSEFGCVEVDGQTFGPVVVFDDVGTPLATTGTMLAPGREEP